MLGDETISTLGTVGVLCTAEQGRIMGVKGFELALQSRAVS